VPMLVLGMALCVIIPVGMLVWFKSRKWL